MMESFYLWLGVVPQADGVVDGAFIPSPTALKAAVPKKTTYVEIDYENGNKAINNKVLMICTEEKYMTMANGKKFSTGNHPVELYLPLLHLEKAGFEIEVATPMGKPVQIEEWAMPSEDEAVKGIQEKWRSKMEKPLILSQVVNNLDDSSPYIAVFIPGGHGAMNGLPENTDLSKLIEWVSAKDKYMITLCHGPATLLAQTQDESTPFVYDGYEMAMFPDSFDKITPYIGYMPGPMPYCPGEKLKAAGVKIVNSLSTGYVHKDRKLITGDGPDAANALGKLAVESLLAQVNGGEQVSEQPEKVADTSAEL